MTYITLKDVTFTYPGKTVPAVKNVSQHFNPGEQVAITGLNGSGKSTLARLMVGLLSAQSGIVHLQGKPVKQYSLAERGRKIGFVYQNPSQMLFNNTVFNEAAFGLKWRGVKKEEVMARCRELLQYFNLWHLREEFPFNLSEGQKQMLVLASILALKPDFLILDEPTKSIDTEGKKKLKEILLDIWRQGTGTIVISHDREFIQGLNRRSLHMIEGEVRENEGRREN